MSSLTDALDRIRAWLPNNCATGAEHVPPGLSLSQIKEIVRTLPFSLPHEVYELYQWSRGNSEATLTNHAFIFDPYEGMALCSLERGMEIAPTFEDEFDEIAVRYVGKALFPIFEFEGSFLCVIGDLEEKESCPIIFVSEIREITIWYVSLTSMMLTLAECFETGVVLFGQNGYPKWDKEKFSPIYRKYNSGLLELALVRLKQELALVRLKPKVSSAIVSDVLSVMVLNNFLGQVYWLTSHWKDLSLDQLAPEATEPLIAAMQHKDESVRRRARQALEELNYTF